MKFLVGAVVDTVTVGFASVYDATASRFAAVLVSTVVVFFLSHLVHVVGPHHKSSVQPLPSDAKAEVRCFAFARSMSASRVFISTSVLYFYLRVLIVVLCLLCGWARLTRQLLRRNSPPVEFMLE